jgi:hypothetical protein
MVRSGMVETNEVSEHLFRVFYFVKTLGGWASAADIAKGASVAPRTARAHALRLVRAGVFEQAEVFPSHRYKLAEKAEKRNKGFYQRLEQAGEVFGL